MTAGVAPNRREHLLVLLLPTATALLGLLAWHGAVAWSGSDLFPKPLDVLAGLVELVEKGLLLKYVVASLFRVTWGFLAAVLVGVPLGLWLGWWRPAFLALNPLIQALRPISPIAWIPISVLAFGIKDEAAIFIIFMGAFFPIVTGAATAVRSMPIAYVRAAHNFGLRKWELLQHVVFPAALPQIITSLRIALGIGWLVVVAAEMTAIQSGLGFLVVDARNMGMRYDLVVAAMLVIGIIGVGLDWLVRRLERLDSVRWGFSKE